MLAGKVNTALKLLTTECYGMHEVNDEKISNLKGKTSKTCTDSSLHTLLWSDSKLALFCYSRQRNDIQSSLFNKGSLWPFTHGRNSFWYVRTSTKCKKENKYLRDKIATSARKLSSKILDWNSFEVYVTCGMIPSNKSSDVVELAKPLLQTATRVQGGAETLIHAMKTVLEHGESKSVILVDEMNMLICSIDGCSPQRASVLSKILSHSH